MNTQFIVHPKLTHFGLTTANLEGMLDWYRKVLGMTVNHRLAVPAAGQHGPPFSAMAFVSNDEVHHHIVFFEIPGIAADPDKAHHARLQHVAFEYETLDDLLGTYARPQGPRYPASDGNRRGPANRASYHTDPDQNSVEPQCQQLRQRVDGDGTHAELARRSFAASACRSRQDARRARGGSVTVGIARAGLRRRVHSREALQSTGATLSRRYKPARWALLKTTDAELLHLLIERGALHSQASGGPLGPAHNPAGLT